MMAEPVSAVVSLVTVSIAACRKTTKWIIEQRLADEAVKNLDAELRRFHADMGLIKDTCNRHHDPTESAVLKSIKKDLREAKQRLDVIGKRIENLKDRKSQTGFQRFTRTLTYDSSEREVAEDIQSIRDMRDKLGIGLSCLSVESISDFHRRISSADQPANPFLNIATQVEEHVIDDNEVSPLDRSLSLADTAYEPSVQGHRLRLSRRPSSETRNSFASSMSGLSQYERINRRSTTNSMKNDTEMTFHSMVSKCGGNDAKIQAIEDAIQQDSKLVYSLGELGRTPLHLAAQRGDIKLAQVLLDNGADINAEDSHPSSVLDLALQNRKSEFVEFLLDNSVQQKPMKDQSLSKQFEEIKDEWEFSKSKSLPKSDKMPKKSKTFGRSKIRSPLLT